jgi:hypothetical protein
MPLSIVSRVGAYDYIAPAQTHSQGNLILVLAMWAQAGIYTAEITGVSDTYGNTYAPLTDRFDFGSAGYGRWFYAYATANNVDNVVQLSDTTPGQVIVVIEVSGAATFSPLDVEFDPSSITTSNANDLLLIGWYTIGEDSISADLPYQTVLESGAYNGAHHAVTYAIVDVIQEGTSASITTSNTVVGGIGIAVMGRAFNATANKSRFAWLSFQPVLGRN